MKMRRPMMAMVMLGICVWLATDQSVGQQQPSAADLLEYRVPAPPTVGTRELDVGFEIRAPMGTPSVHKLNDGRFMMIGDGRVRYSSEGGRTWTTPENLSAPVRFAITLNSGKLGGPGSDNNFYSSGDGGRTWEKGGQIFTSPVPGSPYWTGAASVLTETPTGRLIIVLRFTSGAGHDGLYHRTLSWGTLNGKLTAVEGHAHYPEPDIGFAYYSDDGGDSWQKTEGAVMIWHHDGHGGMWPCDEPSVVTARNGDVIMFFRTTLGRVYTARSSAEDWTSHSGQHQKFAPGKRFDFPRPTPLAGSYSPCAIQRIRSNGDLLIVWNQISGDELRGSYRRGRLSSAISKDDGETWEHFRCLDTSVLPPHARVEPDPIPQMARGLDYVGVLPSDYGGVSYPTIAVADDTVLLFWGRSIVNARPGDVTGRRMRVLPLDWFYGEDEPLPEGPKLILRSPAHDKEGTWNEHEISSDYHDGRFYVHLQDLAAYLKSPVGRLGYDMYAPLNQVITCLGWTAAYDRSKLKDVVNPRMIAECTHMHSGRAVVQVPPGNDVAIVPGAVKLVPTEGIPLKLFGTPVGTKKLVTFNSPIDPVTVEQAWLELEAEDIDEPEEATIVVNEKARLKVSKNVMIPTGSVWGRLVVPVDAIVRGTNTIAFTFADNLGGSTAGYDILHASLVLKLR